MDRPNDSQLPPPPEEQNDQQPIKVVPPTYRALYLILYNFVSALLWSVILGRVLLITALFGYPSVHSGVADFTRWTQTLAALEVLHAAVGTFPTSSPPPPSPTLTQSPVRVRSRPMASRFLLVWLIAYFFPTTVAQSPAYTSMLLAWSVTEVVRYSYFAVNLAYGGVPFWLTWVRYNAFFVLYPLGIGSECWLVWSSQVPGVRRWGVWWERFCWAVLFVYIPGEFDLEMDGRRREGFADGCRCLCTVHAYDGAAEESPAELEREEGCLRLATLRLGSNARRVKPQLLARAMYTIARDSTQAAPAAHIRGYRLSSEQVPGYQRTSRNFWAG
ncbi:hypothetical protein LTS09_009781 [Friedmanniomyces endolithicus]|nr:hypothetical protein LTS09_009781 [Friedmanniomyces endolithicus]